MATLLQTKRLGWAIIFVLVTAVGLLSYFSSRRYVSAMAAVEHTLAMESAVGAMLSSLKDAETGQRGYILSGDPAFLQPYDVARRELPPTFERLRTLAAEDPVQSARVAKARGLTDEKLSFVAETIELRRAGDSARALELVRGGRGKALMDRLRAETRAMLEHEDRVLQHRKQEAHRAETTALWGVGAGSLLTVGFALLSFLTVQRDVDELKRTADELAKSEDYYRLLAEQGSDLVRLMNLDGRATYVSPSVYHLLGYTVEEYLELEPYALLHPDEVAIKDQMLASVKRGEAVNGQATYRLRHRSGEYRWFEVRWAALIDAEGRPTELHLAGRDVTERREAEAKLSAHAELLKALALRDELTGLYNRRGFMEVAGQAHAVAVRDGRPAALVFVDLNGMKRINDELGHDAGDAALVDAADVLLKARPESDVLSRWGGDEFVLFALDFVAADLDPLRRTLRSLADERVTESGRPFRLSLSVGAAYLEVGANTSLSDLLELADEAMYEQKKARRAAGNVSILPTARS